MPLRPCRRWNFLCRHWRGSLPLWVSFWITGLLAPAIAMAALGGLAVLVLRDDGSPHAYAGFLLIIWGFAFSATVWQAVGIFRAAQAHIRFHGRRFWPRAAQVFLALSLAVSARSMATTAWPPLHDALAYLRDDPGQPESAIRVSPDGRVIFVTGWFRWSLTRQLAAALHDNSTARVVVMTSPGGRTGVGNALRAIIQSHRLDTHVAQHCESACTLAFLAGARRTMGPSARIGFHRGSSTDNHQTDMIQFWLRRDYLKLGVKPAFVDHALRIPPTGMWYPRRDEMLEAGVLTEPATAPPGLAL